MAWVGDFKGFLVCTALCVLAFTIPHEMTRTVAACVFVLLCPALFVVSSVDVVRRANARKERGERPSASESVVLLPLRGLVGLFGISTLLIGAVVCAWVLYLSHAGGLPILLALFLGTFALKRVFWAREAVSLGADLVRSALGRNEEDPEPETPTWMEEAPWFVEDLRLEPHGDVPLLLSGSSEEPDPAALALARELPARYPSLRAAIAQKLCAHYHDAREARARDEQAEPPFPRLQTPAQIWQHVSVDHVRVEPVAGVPTLVIALDAAWDVERWLCVRLHDWRRIEVLRDA